MNINTNQNKNIDDDDEDDHDDNTMADIEFRYIIHRFDVLFTQLNFHSLEHSRKCWDWIVLDCIVIDVAVSHFISLFTSHMLCHAVSVIEFREM